MSGLQSTSSKVVEREIVGRRYVGLVNLRRTWLDGLYQAFEVVAVTRLINMYFLKIEK